MIDSYAFYTDKLKGEYLETFKQIEFYCLTVEMDDDSREDRLSELLDIFLSAQGSGKPVKKIIGNDIQQFCTEFCSDVDFKSWMRSFFDKIKFILWYIFVFSFIDMLFIIADIINGQKASIWETEGFFIGGSLIGFAFYIVVSSVFNLIFRYIIHKLKKIPTKFQRTMYYIFSFLAGLVLLFLVFHNVPDFSIPLLASLILSGICLLLYYVLNHDRIKQRKSKKVRFWDMVANEMQNDKNKYKPFIKQYNRINKRRIKKGKECMTYKEFLDKKENSANATKKAKWFFAVFPLLITAFFFLISDFESIIDMVIFVFIMLGVEYLVMYFMYKLECLAIKEQLRLIAELRKNPEKFEE